ncbi:MAG: class I SAM-dependent methyltransferase [Candidatus Thiodiazotropha lotti]|nr:class I SAM-dependent methyltransferase [Candidatus Thiodiazotropha lotti]MCG8001499.1 class I SAM-dependent methyltransferase [Candidatus Thiodiazotropha lotti]MCW4183879.1 class I SAM-dependent methyltransferase [Candidatus Thiodiazotropha weberae]MCW4193273.1 class I SAM-dependent methyltransferase [Candidatus Thiodiazotropha weberae]
MWYERYNNETYAYGINPNTFLTAMYDKLPSGKILCIGEGEGRNAVWLAEQGNSVTAVDISEIGLKKANKLAKSRGVTITTVHSNLADFEIENGEWDAIVSIFCHLPPDLRHDIHRRCVEGLRPGGAFLLEAYAPLQLEYKTGGPSAVEMMMDVPSLTTELTGLEFFHLQERVREVIEGEFHNRAGAVVQVFARKSH